MNIIERKTVKHGVKKGSMKSGKGHFTGAMQKLAKMRQGKSTLQHGNVLTKRAPMGGSAPSSSKIVALGKGLNVQSTPAQKGLNPNQQ